MTGVSTLRTLDQSIEDVTARLLASVEDLDWSEVEIPYLPTINPPLWEVCHATYFFEWWCLRQSLDQPTSLDHADEVFDSTTVAHENRWRLPTPDLDGTRAYVSNVRDRVLAALRDDPANDRLRYLAEYAVYHADMHVEAIAYCRQTLGLPAPQVRGADLPLGSTATGDAAFEGGTFELGARDDGSFCFDNEKWAHEVTLAPFAMSKTAVTEGEFAAFVEDRGYERRELWSAAGWAASRCEHGLPLYWRRGADGYERRVFDGWHPIDPNRAMMHVSWFECEAYCRWAGRRLPTEAEWEFAAASRDKHTWPWDPRAPDGARANLDATQLGAVSVHAYPDGDSPHGLRQMIGNVWEWTSTTFAPYPGFTPDMYAEYSQTSFHTRKVLRGGCWMSSERMLRNTWRNYYTPNRRDVFAGFRTCAR